MGLGAGSTLTLQLVIIARYVPIDLRPSWAVVSVVFIVPGLDRPDRDRDRRPDRGLALGLRR